MTEALDTSKNLAAFRATTPNGRCYETHPPLSIAGHLIHGGSCSMPMVTNADVYVAFDHAPSMFARALLPWNSGGPVCVPYPIQDMGVPSDPAEFKKMIDWLSVQLIADKVVHMGCIGGHGRTGLVLAALVAKMMPDELDAIGYVRKNYCQKAVESMTQVKFLQQHFGVKEAAPAKGYSGAVHGSDDWYAKKGYPTNAKGKAVTSSKKSGGIEALNRAPLGNATAFPLKSTPLSLWGPSMEFGELKNVVQ